MNVLQNCYPRFAKNRILKKEMLGGTQGLFFCLCAVRISELWTGDTLRLRYKGRRKAVGCGKRDDKMRFMDWAFNGRTGCTLWSGGANAVFKAFGERKEDSLDEVVYRIELVLDIQKK